MTYQILKQGTEAVKAGSKDEGRRLIIIALKGDDLTARQRAIGWIWLAEVVDTAHEKLSCYNKALEADPNNAHALQRIRQLTARDLPPIDLPGSPPSSPPPTRPPATTPTPDTSQLINTVSQAYMQNNPPPSDVPGRRSSPKTGTPHFKPVSGENPPARRETTPPQPASPVDYNNFTTQPTPPTPRAVNGTQPLARAHVPRTGSLIRTIGILDGSNGPGTGFFITTGGLVVTTRYIVGGKTTISYELNDKHATAQVVRSWAEYDLALIHTGLQVNNLLTPSNTPVIPDNAPLTAIAHGNRVVNGYRRATKSEIPQGWFPTTIDASHLKDAGGNLVLNEKNFIVGMLTANANRSSPYVFGLHISVIYRLVEQYTQEMRDNGNDDIFYCGECGNLSRAATYGGFYCEHCGSTLPQFLHQERYNLPQMARLYGETMSRPCPSPTCQSTVGFHRGACLRCGHQLTS